METFTYFIKKRIQETDNIFIWHLVPKDGNIFNFKPGQFVMICSSADNITNKRAYSIASSPTNQEYLEFGIKIHGKFTNKIKNLEQGTEVGLQGPFGEFTYDASTHHDAVMFAGGIGITPLISMIRYVSQEAPDNKILLYYCNQTQDDIAYKNTLDDIATNNQNIKIKYSIDKCQNKYWPGDVGLINDSKVKAVIDNFADKHYFLCGPMPFMKAVEDILKKNKVDIKRIKKEVF